MKTLTRIIISTLLLLSVSSICFADPPDPKPPEYTISLPG